MNFKEADFYKKLNGKKVHCKLCPHSCIIENGEVGICQVRMNVSGNLKSMLYGKPKLSEIIAIEKNQIYHLLPGKKSLRIEVDGDTLVKKNAIEIDVNNVTYINKNPNQVVAMAKKEAEVLVFGGEGTTYYEYLMEITKRSESIKKVFATNGFIQKDALVKLFGKIDIFSIEIKSMNSEFYDNEFNVNLDDILDNIKFIWNKGNLIEIKFYIGNEMHNAIYDVRKLVSWILNNLNQDVPIHFIKINDNTSDDLLKIARRTAIDIGMNNIYIDIEGFSEGRTTYCPNCKKPVILRDSEKVELRLNEGKCRCGQEIKGIWQ